jgi:arylsulfatase A-like enzyme
MAVNVDLAPTLLELGNVLPPEDIDGFSLVPLLNGSASRVRGSFLVEYRTDDVFARIVNMGYRALRTDRYKYIRYEELEGMDELYDLVEDPHELVNLRPVADQELIRSLDEELSGHLAGASP